MRKTLLIAASLLFALAVAPAQQLRLSNPLPMARADEVVAVPLAQLAARTHIAPAQFSALVAVDAATGKRIPTQLYSSQPGAAPDELLLLVNLPARGEVKVAFHADASAPALPSLVFGRPVPERKDDFSWENQTVAYRIYGPALQATGEISSGIDVWSKRIPNFVVNDFYARDKESQRTHNPALSYHKDNGVGMDSYAVEPTRGCGGTGVWNGSALSVSKNYTTAHILASGPIRFEFEITYAPWQSGSTTVTETKRITLDAGSHLNKIVSTYTFDGGAPLELAAGLAIHSGADSTVETGRSVNSVWDTPQDPTAGRIATGMVALPQEHARSLTAAGHALMIFTRRSGEPFTYYAGAGWSKADMPTAQDWNHYLETFLTQREHPVASSWAAK